MAAIAQIDTKALAQKQAAYAKAQEEALKARKAAEEKEESCRAAYQDLLAVMQPNKRGPKASSNGKDKGEQVTAGV